MTSNLEIMNKQELTRKYVFKMQEGVGAELFKIEGRAHSQFRGKRKYGLIINKYVISLL